MATEEDYFVPSSKLKELDTLIKAWGDVSRQIGAVVQFKVVVDSNVVLGDIRWLVSKRANPTAKTSLIETVEAGTIDVYVPPSLFSEVAEHLERISIEEGISREKLLEQWAEYRKALKVLDPEPDAVSAHTNGVDPDDAPFIALAESIAAAGIVSNDAHIGKMGGNRISVQCIVSLRDYSRAKAVELNIKLTGLSLGIVSIGALLVVFSAIKAVGQGIKKLPDWLKAVIFIVVLICVIHPGTRTKIIGWLKNISAKVKDATPSILSQIAAAVEIAERQKAIATEKLVEAQKELEPRADKNE